MRSQPAVEVDQFMQQFKSDTPSSMAEKEKVRALGQRHLEGETSWVGFQGG